MPAPTRSQRKVYAGFTTQRHHEGKMAKIPFVFHTGCAQRGVGHTVSGILSLDQRMPVYRESGQSLSYTPPLFLPIKLWDHLKESRISCFLLILFLAFTFAEGVKGSGSGNPFSAAQYFPVGTPQESLAQSTKDPRKGLHHSSLSGMPSLRENAANSLATGPQLMKQACLRVFTLPGTLL